MLVATATAAPLGVQQNIGGIGTVSNGAWPHFVGYPLIPPPRARYGAMGAAPHVCATAHQVLHKVKHTRMAGLRGWWEGRNQHTSPTYQPDHTGQALCQSQHLAPAWLIRYATHSV